MVRHLVAAVDATAESLAAAHWAAREAARRDLPLRLVHVWQWRPTPAASVPLGTTQHAWAEQTLRGVAGSVRAAHPGLRITDRLVRSDAALAAPLVEAAAEAELMVLGSRGLGGLAGFVLGSVSQRVVARSPRPVVLVRAGQASAGEHLPAVDGVSPDEIPETPYRDVVLGLDTGRPCDELIEFAFEAAHRRADAALRVLHALGAASGQHGDGRPEPATAPEATAPEATAPEAAAGRERAAVAAALRPWREKFPDVPVVETVTEGRAGAELVRASSAACLVVVGRRRRQALVGGHIGPVAHAVLHHARCPVAVVPHD
ncbi:universal stress protein [Streptomyces sp. NPDC004065]|uniref:universal stress protein n=1 Tax=Streptomyces sp. NPDC004065 TaxID=3364689 RepID=UPI00384F46D1